MTDEELLARLREYREINEGSTGVSYDPIPECLAAAALIEALIRENTNLRQIERNVQAVREHEFKRAEAAEAKLAKAVEALETIRKISLCSGSRETARATLAEIKKPIAEWPEETGNIMVGKLKGESHE